jgi:hypothetical protein
MNWQCARFISAIAFFLGLVLCSCGQPATKSEQTLKDMLVHLDRAHTEYDRFKDETISSSATGKVAGALFMSFSYSCHGNSTECDPGVVMVTFLTSSPDRYADSHEVIFLADGRRIHPPKYFGTPVWHSLGNGHEMLGAGLETDDFLNLIRAHSVEGELGTTEFTAQESDLEKWRTFAAGIRSGKNPEPKRKP